MWARKEGGRQGGPAGLAPRCPGRDLGILSTARAVGAHCRLGMWQEGVRNRPRGTLRATVNIRDLVPRKRGAVTWLSREDQDLGDPRTKWRAV